jgi:serine/threonine-protein kinase
MGQVYLARTTGLGGFERKVVVKTLDSDPNDDDTLVAMFLDEARLVGALHHQYIAPVYEVGRDERGRYFLVMEYVRGETAEAMVAAAKQIGMQPQLPFAIATVAAVAAALHYAHELRAPDDAPLEIVHRDVSPSNIMIGHDGGVKLIDFGIAKFSRRTSQTQIGSLKGKLGYLSPEQVLSKPVDRRADIFALGIVLYELTTFTRAFEGASELITLERITKGEMMLPSQLVPAYPRELERIVMRALAIDPDLRFSDAATMGRELEAFAARRGLPIGHAAVADVMHRLFDPSTPDGRRRFARSSSEVDTGRQEIDGRRLALRDAAEAAMDEIDDIDITPVEAVEPVADEKTEAYRSAGHPMPPDDTGDGDVTTVPIAPPLAAPAPAPAPLVVRLSSPSPRALTPQRVITATAQIVRMSSPRMPVAPARLWWFPYVLVMLAIVIALVIALV